MMILKSYLTNLFARKKPLVLAGSLYFEQSYARASKATPLPVRNWWPCSPLWRMCPCGSTWPLPARSAIPGDHGRGRGDAEDRGVLQGLRAARPYRQPGVIIPHDNVDHLMLSPDVLQAVEKGQFAIYAVRSIEEALTLLTGLPVGRRRKDDTFTPAASTIWWTAAWSGWGITPRTLSAVRAKDRRHALTCPH